MPDTSASGTPPEQPASAAVAAAATPNPQPQPAAADSSTDDRGELSKLSHEQCSTSKPSSNELTNGLKRPLLDTFVENDAIKKIRLVEENRNKEKQDVTVLSNKNRDKEDLSEENDQIACLIKTAADSISKVPVNIPSKNDGRGSVNDTNCDIINVKSPSRTTEEERHKKGPSDTTVPSRLSESAMNHKNGIVRNENSSSCRRLSSDNSTVIENSKEKSEHKDGSGLVDVEDKAKNSSNPTGSTSFELSEVPCSVAENNSKTNKEPPLNPQNTTNNNSPLDTGADLLGLRGNKVEVMELTDSDSDNGVVDENAIDSKVLDEVVGEGSKLNDSNFVNLMRLFDKNNIPFQQFESFITQKCAEFLTQTSERGQERLMINDFLQREKEWRNKTKILLNQQRELKAIIRLHQEDMAKNPVAKPHVITRTVGLQASLNQNSREIGFRPILKTSVATTTEQSVSISVNIISDNDDDDDNQNDNDDNDDDVEEVHFIDTQNSNRGTTESATSVLSSSPSVEPSNSHACIDLTDDSADDLITVNNTQSLRSPVKIAPRPTSTSGLTIPSSLSTTSTMVTGSNRPPVAGFFPISGNIVKHGRYAIVSPLVNRQVQPVNLYARPMQNSQINLEPVPPAMPIHRHPAPLPMTQNSSRQMATWKKLPPAPILTATISEGSNNALLLTWNFSPGKGGYAEVTKYQIFAYHEIAVLPKSDLWSQIGEVSALPLPMACSLTQFTPGQKYHFAVRAVDVHSRCGPYSLPQSIILNN